MHVTGETAAFMRGIVTNHDGHQSCYDSRTKGTLMVSTTPALRIALASLALTTLASAQKLPFEKYKLDNGMTVILHVDHSLPNVTINTWYRVGARNEPPGRSGFAHLFEHLMFMGTRRVPGNAFDVVMETGGGWNNASTNLDRTNYFSSGPSDLLPTLLWLDADRLDEMGRTMTKEKLDKQVDVVRNEIRENVENTPYGRAYEGSFSLLFPQGHPYHNGVYGTHADLTSATVQDVKDFFSTFYVPSNASLVIAGDFDPAEIKPLVAKMFGTLPAGAAPTPRAVADPQVEGVVRSTMLDRVEVPRLAMSWISPGGFAPGDAELMLAGQVLTEGQNSRLYQRLVLQEPLAVSVSAEQENSRLNSIFRLSVEVKPDADMERVEAIVDEEIRKLQESGPTEDELRQRQATAEHELLTSLQSVAARADKLNEYEFYLGTPDGLEKDLSRFRGATAQGVAQWTKRVLDLSHRLIIRVLPDAVEPGTSARESRPAAARPRPFAPPAPETFKLQSGITVNFWPMPDLPLVTARMTFLPGGPLDLPKEAGAAVLMATMLTEGAGARDSGAFSAALQQLGATMSAHADREAVTVGLSSLARNFDKAAELWADAVLRPRFAEDTWKVVHANHVQELEQDREEPTTVALKVATRALYGDESRWAWPTAGLVATVGPLTLDRIKARHAELVHPSLATIFISGSLTTDELKPILEKAFGGWTSAATAASRVTDDPKVPPTQRMLFVDRPNAVQTVIRFASRAVPFADPGRVPMRLLNVALGGSFTSRLNQNLRERNGYTYGARSSFEFNRTLGAFTAGAAVRAEATGAALKEFLAEFAKIRAGDLSDDEVTKARRMMKTEFVQGLDSMEGRLGFASELLRVEAPWATISKDVETSESVTAAQVNKLAKDALALERGVLVLVGDKKLILEQTKDLGLPAPVEVDADGAPVKP